MLGMGNTQSAKKRQQRKELLKKMEEESKKTRPFETKNVLFLHKSNAAQLDTVRNFRDALILKTNGTVHVTYFVNIADENEIPESLEWLNELNNVVLVCLTSEAIQSFERIVRKKRFADENGQLHEKLFTVTFGEKLDSQWPPKGLKTGSTDLRDFYFGFTDVENIRPQDFKKSLRLNSLIAAIKATT